MTTPTPNPTLIAGRYRLLRELGRGASATVYLAEDGLAGTQVAVLKQACSTQARQSGFGELRAAI